MVVDENDFYRQASLRICGNLEIEKALHNCFLYLSQFIPATEILLFLTEHELRAVRMIAKASSSGGEMVDTMVPLPPEAFSTLKGSALPNIRIVNNPEEDPVCRASVRWLKDPPASSLLIMFLTTHGRRMGSAAVVLRVNGLGVYDERHLRLFSLLNEPFAISLSNHLRHMEILQLKDLLVEDNKYLHQELHRARPSAIVGGDFGLRDVMQTARCVAPQRTTVLLLGETGVGKEIVADTIQRLSPRSDYPYIKVNCGAISPSLIDSELFGHEKGAFTGATGEKKGRFERAHKGTIFLDEIAELGPEAQFRLLRVLQNKELERVGGTKTIRVDIRVIAATNRDLAEMVGTKQFREDLWFRLNIFPIHIPPLRERTGDIPALVQHFLKKKAKELNLRAFPRLAPNAIDRLMSYSWPGNVRELENIIERALILNQELPLSFHELEMNMRLPTSLDSAGAQDQMRSLDEITRSHIIRVLQITKGKINGPDGCAKILGLKPNTLRYRMHQLGIPHGRNTRASEATDNMTAV